VTTPESPYAPAPAPATTPAPVPVGAAEPSGTDTRNLVLTAVLAVVLLVSAVINAVSGTGFPSNAPVEQIWNFGITVDLVAGGLALIIRFLVIRKRPRLDAAPRSGVSPLALAAVIIAVAVLAGWLLLGGLGFLGSLVSGFGLRYYLDTNGTFFLGIPWMLGLFFGAAALRKGRGIPTTVAAVAAIAISLLILVPTLFSAVAYGLGLTA
jgi:hypothetical protein